MAPLRHLWAAAALLRLVGLVSLRGREILAHLCSFPPTDSNEKVPPHLGHWQQPADYDSALGAVLRAPSDLSVRQETDRYWNAIVGNGGQESACDRCFFLDIPFEAAAPAR